MQCLCGKSSCPSLFLQTAQKQPVLAPALPRHHANRHRNVAMRAEEREKPSTSSAPTASEEQNTALDVDSFTAKKQAEAERLRAAERFMVVGGDNGTCKSCGYNYTSDKGDPEFPVAKGTRFAELPQEYTCPVCSAPKSQFQSDARMLAGFAENQKYGLGFNGVTGSQKLLVIYGGLAIGFLLLIGGYALE